MTRRYDEPVEVRRRDEDPAEFLWHGRFYVVRAVLAHWVETGAWWRVGSTSGSSALAADPSAQGAERVLADRETRRPHPAGDQIGAAAVL